MTGAKISPIKFENEISPLSKWRFLLFKSWVLNPKLKTEMAVSCHDLNGLERRKTQLLLKPIFTSSISAKNIPHLNPRRHFRHCLDRMQSSEILWWGGGPGLGTDRYAKGMTVAIKRADLSKNAGWIWILVMFRIFSIGWIGWCVFIESCLPR